MNIKPLLLAATSVLATTNIWAAPDCAALDAQVNSWQAYLQSYGSPSLLNIAGFWPMALP